MLFGVIAGSLSLASAVQAATPLRSVLISGDHAGLEQLLKGDPALAGGLLESGLSPLSLAVTRGDLESVVLLVGAGAEVAAVDGDGMTALQRSIVAGQSEMTGYLLKHSGERPGLNGVGQGGLHWCAQAGDAGLCERFLKQGFTPLDQDANGQTPLEVAISYGQLSLLGELLDQTDPPASRAVDTLTFDDDRLRYWSALYWAGRETELMASLEADLLSAAPQPMAAYVWSKVYQRQDRLEAAWQATEPALQKALGRVPLVLIGLDKDPAATFEAYPADAGYSLSEVYALVDLAAQARDDRQYSLFFDYLEAAIRIAPDHWQLAWMAGHMPTLDAPGMRDRLTAFSNDPQVRDGLVADYLRAMLPHHSWWNSDRLVFIDRFLAANPQDSRALAARSQALNGNAYYAEALEAEMAAISRFPFYAGRKDGLALLMKTGQAERARRVAKGLAAWFGSDNLAARGARYYGAALLDDGNPGGARVAVDEALVQFPGDARLWLEKARLELVDDHPEQALAAALKGFALLDEPSEGYLETLLEAYRKSGDGRSAVAAFEQYRGQLDAVSAGLLDAVLDDLETLEDRQAYGQLLAEARSQHPRDLTLLRREARQQWDKGNQRQALALLEEALPGNGDSQALLDQLYEYTLAVRGQAGVRQMAAQAINERPWEKVSWTLAERSGLKTAPGMWEEAIAAAPLDSFACDAMISHYVDKKAWDEAHGWARDCLQRQAALGDQARLSASQSLMLYDAWVYENQTRNQRVPREDIVAAEERLGALLDGRGHRMDYLRYREALCLARQDKVCAAQALASRSEYQRDDTGHFHDLVARYSSELGANKTFGYGARMLARNPNDIRIVNSFLHKHLLWGGSPIVALKAINDAKARGMDVDSSWERKALGQLGDSLSEFEQYTVAGKRPGGSLRYVNWFNDARRSALSADGTRVFYQLDGEMPGVEILLPSGEQVVRRDHPVFGKPVYFARGASFLKLVYTASGQLQSIDDSSGAGIALQYDADDQISEMTSPEGTLRFTYNDFGKPVRIVEVGLGVLDVTYDDNGEILSVNSEDGHEMALHITRSFQALLGMVNKVKQIHDVKRLPTLTVDDPELDALREEFENTEYLSAEEQKSALTLAEYLLDHVGDSPDYVSEAEGLLYGVIVGAQEHGKDKRFVYRGADAVAMLHRLYREVRPRGLPESTFNEWSGAYGWLRSAEQEKSRSKLRKTLAVIDESPLVLLRDAHRLQRSDFSNTAYWKRYGNQELFGEVLAGAEKHQVLLRDNGDVVVATSKGLSVLHEGYWHWYGVDARTQRLSETVSPQALDERSHILSLAETSDGVLWLGTVRGLMAMAGDYQGDLKRWSVAQGLPSPRIASLAQRDEQVWVGTAKGLVRLQYADDAASAVAVAGEQSIDQLYRLPGEESALLYRSENQVWLLAGGETLSLGRGSDLAFEMDRMRVYRLDNDQVFAHGLTDENGVWEALAGEPLLVAGRNDLLMSKRIHELSMWALGDGEEALVVNTDQGMNVLLGNYFEALPLPFAEQRGGLQVGPRQSWSDGRGVVLLSDDGVYTRLETGAQQLPGQRVYDLLVSDALDAVFIAMGDHIMLLGNDLPLEAAQYFSSANARKLVQDAQGNLITHDGSAVLRFKTGSDRPQELFDARPGVEEDGWHGRIVDMLVDSRGTLWVVAGSSLFRYENEQVTEFNYLIDSEAFPSRSPLLAGVHETLDGVIEVVASDESHLFHQGVKLAGGLLRWNGKGFDNVGKPANWFVTGYTVVDERTALLGTNSEFARELAGENSWEKRQTFPELNDPSYLAVKEKSPLFWLGGEGSRFNNENSWLFPSAGGVVLYHGGTWLYPDRLNQLLPGDQGLGQYGGRTVHAVAVAANGRVYAGTDLGLLVYDARGVASLLADNQFGQLAFADGDTSQQQALSDIFLPSIPRDSEQGKLLQRYQAMQAQIRELEEKANRTGELAVASESSVSHPTQGMPSQSKSTPEAARLRQQLDSKNRLRETLLARMETEHFGLYQMLKLDPREVAAMHQRLGEKQALVQYLPTPEKLLIQLVTREGAQIREVAVSREDLELVSQLVVKGLRYRASHIGEGPDRGLSASRGQGGAPDTADMEEHLAWLYDKLLRPVERELEGKQQVLITPVGALTYLPFPALLRQQGEHKEYAAERFNLGVIPSMYHLSLVLQQNASYSDGLTLVADPDGSLPGARQEVSRIAAESLVTPTVLEGRAATYDALSGAVREARVVHLATHGNLDPAVPADSYLLLANNYRLNVIDIAALKLDQTDLVVLSACETGIGKPGLEYATLARAFALASVPTVVASYWKVDDGATADLMEQFYGNLRDNPDGDYLGAMAAAQRALIRQGGKYADPAAWAAFTLFGKP